MAETWSFPWLNFVILASGCIVILGVMAQFLRSRHNRHVAARTLAGDGRSHAGIAPDGAGPELLAVGIIALLAMALLAVGYSAQ